MQLLLNMTHEEFVEKYTLGEELIILIVKPEIAGGIGLGNNDALFWDRIRTDNYEKYTEAIEKVDTEV